MGASGSSAFVLETDELLREVKVDYAKAFPGLDQTLRQLKDAIEGLEQYGPRSCTYHGNATTVRSVVYVYMADC